MALVLKGVNKVLGDPPNHILHDISCRVESGEFVSITGKSGSGKSTLLYVMSTLDHASSGELEIDGKNVTRMTKAEVHHFRNQSMGFVFQFHYLLPELNAFENVLMPAMKSGKPNSHRDQAKKLLEEFGLGDKLHRLPRHLSGGEQQRVAIARALVMSPRYIFADEPTGNLDSANGKIVMDLFKRINRERQTTVVFVTHDPDFAATALRTITLVDGYLQGSNPQ